MGQSEGVVAAVREELSSLPLYEGSSKVMNIKDAVEMFVKPGMSLYMAQHHYRYAGAVYEIARQFWGKGADFTLVDLSVNMPATVLLQGGMVRKIITGYCGDMYYTPGPSRVFRDYYLGGEIEFENWSLLTLVQRLMAGAMGLPFITTRSLIGSSMAETNTDGFQVVDDPFGSRKKVGLLKALHPDLAIVHGWAADPYGNTILHPPYMENVYGAMGSRQGVIVTVEKIVSTEYIRQHAHLVKIPGYMVCSVSELPFGAHPYGMSQNLGLDIEGYAEDYDFVNEAKKAARSKSSLEEWAKEWVLDVPDHAAYLRKLGKDRLYYLKGKAEADIWKYALDEALRDTDLMTQPYKPVEMAVIAASRQLQEKVKANGYKTILSGGGLSNLSAWHAIYGLKQQNQDADIMAEAGIYGYLPRPGDPALFNHRNFPTCKMLTDTHFTLGILVGGETNRCIGSLGFAEIDKYGNINTTMVPGKDYIGGSGGANDIASTAREVIVTGMQSKNRLLERVSYVTSPGSHVRTLVTTLGVFEKLGGEEFILTAYYPQEGKSEAEVVELIKSECRWELQVASRLEKIDPPTMEELILLRSFDPNGYFLGKQIQRS